MCEDDKNRLIDILIEFCNTHTHTQNIYENYQNADSDRLQKKIL